MRVPSHRWETDIRRAQPAPQRLDGYARSPGSNAYFTLDCAGAAGREDVVARLLEPTTNTAWSPKTCPKTICIDLVCQPVSRGSNDTSTSRRKGWKRMTAADERKQQACWQTILCTALEMMGTSPDEKIAAGLNSPGTARVERLQWPLLSKRGCIAILGQQQKGTPSNSSGE